MIQQNPERILQIGEGNFLRGFFDWMIHHLNVAGTFQGSVVVVAPRPTGRANVDKINAQSGRFTVWTRGLQDNEPVETFEVVECVSRAVDPYANWAEFLRCAENYDMNICVSNTTEAGIQYAPEDYHPDVPLVTFPAKVTAYLYHRYRFFEGSPDAGMTFLPCELVSKNGHRLRDIVLRHAAEWELPDAFQAWVRQHNAFCNTLVDRIVAGHPTSPDIDHAFAVLGYEDALLTVAEPYHLWAIEGAEHLRPMWDFQSVGLNVSFVDDVMPFSTRKIRILNAGHTAMCGVALLTGKRTVRDALTDPVLRTFVWQMIHTELAESLTPDETLFARDSLKAYCDSVLERFSNPYIEHPIASLMTNGLAKIRTRLVAAFEDYTRRFNTLPKCLSLGLSALLLCYRQEDRAALSVAFTDDEQSIRSLADTWCQLDDGDSLQNVVRALLALSHIWGRDLNDFPGLATEVESMVRAAQKDGWREVMEKTKHGTTWER